MVEFDDDSMRAEKERDELRAYHEQLRRSKGDDLEHLLKTGPLPDSARALIDAGLQMMPMVDTGTVGSLAAARLEAIVAKLRLSRHPDADESIRSFEMKLAEHRSFDRKMTIGCFALLTAVVAALVWWFLRR